MNFVIPIASLFLKSWNAKNYPSILTCLGEENIHATYNPCGFENIVAKWVCLIFQGYIYIRLVIIFQVDIQKKMFLLAYQKSIMVALNSVVVSTLNSHSIDGGSIPHTFT